MYNLKRINGTFKGIIGECLFKTTKKWAVLPKHISIQKYLSLYGNYLKREQIEFLQTHWYSIDSIEILFEQGRKIVTLYEIKTKNKYATELWYKPKMTLATHELYNTAKTIGFIVQIATVTLYENWEYTVTYTEFDEKYYCIDKPKKYDNHTGAL